VLGSAGVPPAHPGIRKGSGSLYFTPAGDIGFVREIIEAHKAGDFLLETFLVAGFIDRLKEYNFVSVRLN
jgi:hypothetical protein